MKKKKKKFRRIGIFISHLEVICARGLKARDGEGIIECLVEP